MQQPAQSGFDRSFNTQPPEGGWQGEWGATPSLFGFNTQPPEGGWQGLIAVAVLIFGFNTQPPEGGWAVEVVRGYPQMVSTHSRPKAAGKCGASSVHGGNVSTHSRPKAAGFAMRITFCFRLVSTHSRPKAAGQLVAGGDAAADCFNTQPPEGGWSHKNH